MCRYGRSNTRSDPPTQRGQERVRFEMASHLSRHSPEYARMEPSW
jgi:hypothetical protein